MLGSYFIKNNCAYAIAELLEVVTGFDFVTSSTVYYPPARLFHDLDEYDSANPGLLVKTRTYVPSQDKLLVSIMQSLNDEEADFVRDFITESNVDLTHIPDGMTQHRFTLVLEVLLEYYDYMIIGYPEIGDSLTNKRIEVIKARLRLPPGKVLKQSPIKSPALPPGQTARTTKLGLGIDYADTEISGRLSFSPFSLHPLDLGNSDLSEMTVLKTEINFSDSVELEDFTLIKVAQRTDLRSLSILTYQRLVTVPLLSMLL